MTAPPIAPSVATDVVYSSRESMDLSQEAPPQVQIDPVDPRGKWPELMNLDETTLKTLANWTRNEIELALSEKDDVVYDWSRIQEQYWARPRQYVKNFPFQRAANVVVPLTAIAVEAVHARLMNTLFTVEPFWSVRPKSKSWIDAAKPMEEFLQSEVEDSTSLSAYTFANDSLTELVKLGTCVGKSGYVKEYRKTNVPTEEGLVEPLYVESQNGATLDYVPCANFLFRQREVDLQQAAWCGEEHTFTWGQLKKMSQSGKMYKEAVDRIKTYVNDLHATGSRAGSPEEYRQEMDRLQNIDINWSTQFSVWEIWLAFDVDGDDEDEEIVIDYHLASDTILSARYNWYDDLHRPYRMTQYVKVEGRLWGIGVGKMNEQFQEIVTTIQRQRLDNATLANMRMLAVKKGIGITPDEPIFPGKMWFVDDPGTDIAPIQLSEIYPSSYANEESVVRYSEKRTGVNEVILGIQPQGTPGTATGDLARIAEGNKRFDLVLRNVRKWLGELGKDVVANYQQFGDQFRYLFRQEEDGLYVEKVLQMPETLVARGAVIEVTASSSIVSRQVEQQQWMSLFALTSQYYDRLLQLGQFIQDPQLFAEIVLRAMTASDEALKRLLDTFTVQDADRLLFFQEEERNAQRKLIGPGGNGGGPSQLEAGRPELVQGVSPEEGLARFLDAASRAGAAGDSAARIGNTATTGRRF